MTNNSILDRTVNRIYESLKHGHHNQLDHNPHKHNSNFSQRTREIIEKPKSDYTDLWDKSLSVRYDADDSVETKNMSDKISALNNKLQKRLEKQYQKWDDNLSEDELVAFQDYTSNYSE